MSHGKMPIVDAKESEPADEWLEKWRKCLKPDEREKIENKADSSQRMIIIDIKSESDRKLSIMFDARCGGA